MAKDKLIIKIDEDDYNTTMQGHDQKWQRNHRSIRDAFVKYIKINDATPTIIEIAEATSLNPATVGRHIEELKFESNGHPLKILTNDVLISLAKQAMAGNSQSTKLWFQLMEGYSDRMEIAIDGKLDLPDELKIKNSIKDKLETALPIMNIVLGNVCAKKQISSRYLIEKLINSYYAKHSGFMEPDKSLEEDIPSYPSSIAYNFDDIRSMNKEVSEKEAENKKITIDITPEQNKKGLSLKEKLRKKTQDRKNNL